MTVPVNVNGITNQYSAEYTTSGVRTEFQAAIDAIIAVGSSASAATPPTNFSLVSFNDALNQLKKMALGIDPITGLPLSSSITSGMAKVVDSLITLTQAINPNISLTNSTGFDTTQQLTTWSDLYYSGVQNTLAAFASVSDGSTSSLQSFIELEYVNRGNQYLYDQMSQLNDAMNATNQALVVLGKVQNLLDKAVIVAPTNYTSKNWAQSGFPTPHHTIGARSAPGAYRDSTSQSFGQPLLIQVNPTFATQIQTEGVSYIAQMKDLITTLNGLNPAGATDSTSLQAKLQTVVNDMSQAGSTSVPDIGAWALDNDNHVPGSNPALAGVYQRNITNAISNAQHLNTSQNTSLESLLFHFQQFYSSASTLLRTINRLINQMSSKMG